MEEIELLSSASSAFPKKEKTYTEVMDEMFPMYLDAGMTPDEYWNGDVTWAIAYRKVLERRREWQNQMLWLQGLYVYHAIKDIVPAFSIKSKATQIEPYLEDPIPITERSRRELEERKERERFEKNLAYMKAQATRINTKFAQKRKGVTTDG